MIKLLGFYFDEDNIKNPVFAFKQREGYYILGADMKKENYFEITSTLNKSIYWCQEYFNYWEDII